MTMPVFVGKGRLRQRDNHGARGKQNQESP
jgi:hypothetical protein